MALTVNNFIGFETDGLEEASTTTGTPDPQVTVLRTGSFSLELQSGENYDISPFESVTDAGDKQIVGIAFQIADVTPANNTIILFARESTVTCFQLNLLTTGTLRLNYNSGVSDDITPGFSVDTWHYIEVVWDHTTSGEIEVFIDNSSVFSGSSKDLSGGGTFDTYRLGNNNTHDTFFLDDFYCMSGGILTDRLGDAEVFMYQNTVEDATDQGDALANGTWALVGQTPGLETSTNDAFYQDTGNLTGSTICDSADSNARPGPSGDSNIDGDSNIKAMKVLGRFKRGAGGGRTHEFYGGNDGAGANHATWIASNDAKTLGMTLSTSMETFTIISESTEVPNSSEDFQYGFSKSATAGQDIFCGDIWAMLLHVPTDEATSTSTPELQALSITAVGEQPYEGVGTPTLEIMSLAAIGVMQPSAIGALTTEPFVLTSVGVQKFLGTGVPDFEIMSLTAVGVAGAVIGTGAPTFNAMDLVAVGLMQPSGTGIPDFEAMNLVAAGVHKFLGVGTPNLEIMELLAVGEMPFEGVGVLNFEGMELVSVGLLLPSATGVPALETMILAATGELSVSGTGEPTLEDMELIAAALMQPTGTSTPTLEAITMTAIGVISAIITGGIFPRIRRRRR